MAALENERANEQISFPDIARLEKSKSFHESAEGKIWVRLSINLCWWLHDMYEIVGDGKAKLNYIENKLAECKLLFPARFVLMFSSIDCMPNEQHPFLICRQDEHKTILLVFRATVSSKSIQDVFTDLTLYSDHKVYEGGRHKGFSKRAESGPLLAVVNWLRQGWKVIVTGHSLGGAVSQLFTAKIITSLTGIGLTVDQVVLRCITFGVPQCADRHFWSSYAAWYDVFDTYIYENDAIFRLVMFGADQAKGRVEAFGKKILNVGKRIIEYMDDISSLNSLTDATIQITNIINDAFIPDYSVFGRHHFIVKDHQATLKINSIGDSDGEKNTLLDCLVNKTRRWQDAFKHLIPLAPFEFAYREFLDHGCYPFAINQLFNKETTERLGKRDFPKQILLRSPLDNTPSKLVFNLSAFIYSQNEDYSNPYVYLKGFLVDFIQSVKLPLELAESEQHRKQTVVMAQEQSDGCAVSYVNSLQAKEFIKNHSTFFVKIKTYFGSCNTRVGVLSNVNNPTLPNVYALDPISTVLRAYYELVLDATSTEQYNASALSRSFSIVFNSFQHIHGDEFDKILARYLAEVQSANYMNDIENYLENRGITHLEDDLLKYFDEELKSLKQTSEDTEHTSNEMRETAKNLYELLSNTLLSHIVTTANTNVILLSIFNTRRRALVPLYLQFTELQKHLRQLHNHQEIDIIQNTLKSIMAPCFFLKIKLNRLVVSEKELLAESVSSVRETFSNCCLSILLSCSPWVPNKSEFRRMRRKLAEIAIILLLSNGKEISSDKDEWQNFMRLQECDWLDKITKVKSKQERDVLWDQTFKNKPLQSISTERRSHWIGLMQLCSQVVLMREILIQKPPKVVLSGRSQTGKSTLFKYLTGRDLKELRNIDAFNTRMSLQCPALIKFNDGESNKEESGLLVDVVDNPGQDDATGQAKNLLNMTLYSASLFIVVTTLTDVNGEHTIELIKQLLRDTRVNILVLINQIDDRLFKEWENSKKKDSNNDEFEDNDWENLKKAPAHTTTESTSKFSALDTIRTLIKRPIEELKRGLLTTNLQEIGNRITIKPVILKNILPTEAGYTVLQNFGRDEIGFIPEISKSNINAWIIDKLTKSTH